MSKALLRFVDTTQSSFVRKRKQSSRACDLCRRKKKRCRHCVDECIGQAAQPPSASWTPTRARRFTDVRVPGSHVTPNQDSQGIEADANRFACDGIDDVDYAHKVFNYANSLENGSNNAMRGGSGAGAVVDHDARFIGDTNPEGVFFATGDPQTESFHNASSRCNVGVWSQHRSEMSRFSERLSTRSPYHGMLHGLEPAIRDTILPVLKRKCLFVSPPPGHRNALCAIYFEKFNSILPIIDRSVYDSRPTQHHSQLPLNQAMCMVAAMDPSSISHLYISGCETQLTRSEFGHKLFTALRMSVELRQIEDRLLLVQLHALMSLFKEGHDACENSTLMIGRAVQHVHSLGLHLHLDLEHMPNDHAQRLFCCVWFLDRLNAASHGRPILMHERDNSRSLQDNLDAYEPPFRLLLRIGLHLDDVISMYRPKCTNNELLYDIPLFEDLVVECQAVEVMPRVLATIEVFYHAVTILSYYPKLDTNQRQVSSSRKIQQHWSAERATALVGNEFLSTIVPFPFVPYAVSLSLSLNYRELRRSKLPTQRARAKTAMETNCSILEQLGEISGLALTMAEMGRLTLKELDRVCGRSGEVQQRRTDELPPQQDRDTPVHIVAAETLPTVSNHYESYYFTGVPGPDPFEMFDPDFDLTGVDSFFESSLDPSFPLLYSGT